MGHLSKEQYVTQEQQDEWVAAMREAGYDRNYIESKKPKTQEEHEKGLVGDTLYSGYLPVLSFAVGLVCFFLFMDNGLAGEHFIARLIFNLIALVIWCAGARFVMVIASALFIPRYSKQSKKKRVVYAAALFIAGAFLFTLFH